MLRPALGLTQLPIPLVPAALSLKGKLQVREVDKLTLIECLG